jgi:hypothetical protein
MEIKIKMQRMRGGCLSNLDCTVGMITSNMLDVPLFTLEDKERKVKVPGRTAIACGSYPLLYTMSNRFRRMMFLLDNVPNFSGVRVHAGNTTHDTEGCILLGLGLRFSKASNVYNLTDSREAVSIFEDVFTKAINSGNKLYMEVS